MNEAEASKQTHTHTQTHRHTHTDTHTHTELSNLVRVVEMDAKAELLEHKALSFDDALFEAMVRVTTKLEWRNKLSGLIPAGDANKASTTERGKHTHQQMRAKQEQKKRGGGN